MRDKDRRSYYDRTLNRKYADEDADKTYSSFYERYGPENEEEKKFIDTNYPERKRSYYEVLGIPRQADEE